MVLRAQQMNRRSALSVDPVSVERIERPDAVQLQSAIGADAGFRYGNRIQSFNRVETNVCERRGERFTGTGHEEILAKSWRCWRSCRYSSFRVRLKRTRNLSSLFWSGKIHARFLDSISATFFFRVQLLISFSRAIALNIVPCGSNHTRRFTLYLLVNPGILPCLCWPTRTARLLVTPV